MSLIEIEQARRDANQAKLRLEETIGEVQERFRPKNLAEEAWDGVKTRGADIADGAVQAVKKRPGAVSLALGAVALFLARRPLKRAAMNIISGGEEDGIEADEGELNDSADVEEGVN